LRLGRLYCYQMRVLEEPFITRETILAVLRPGQPAGEGRFRTLRQRRFASVGLRVELRSARGRVLGQAHFYSSLNADAARAVRWGELQLAQSFADQAEEIERSSDAALVREAVRAAGSRIDADPLSDEVPISLRRYLSLRARFSPYGLGQDAMLREWIVHSAAWLSEGEYGELERAATALAQAAGAVRAQLASDVLPQVTTFLGVVRRMDSFAAEVQGESETRLVPRDDLDRQGLAILGQPVALLCETLPAGGSLVLPMPAVGLKRESDVTQSPWDIPENGGGILGSVIGEADRAWLQREIAREPTAVPLAPIRRL
jgi:hypothetical protein